MLLIATAVAAEVQVVHEAPFELRHVVLDNGLEVFLQPRADSTSVLGLVVVRGGGRFESPETSGASHLLEHMLFTKTELWDERGVRNWVEDLGGSYNGYTYAESVRYHAWLGADHLPELLLWLEQVVFHPELLPAELDKEREVVFEERGGRDGWWMTQVHDAGVGRSLREAASEAYWPDTMLPVPHIGEDSSLDGMSLPDLEGFYGRHYRPDNAALVLVGRLEVESTLARIEQGFGLLDNPEGSAPTAPSAPSAAGAPTEDVIWQPAVYDQFEVAITAPTVGSSHPDHRVTELAASYLEDLLFERMRTDRALVYGVSAWNEDWLDAGFLCIRTELDHEKVDEALELMHIALDELSSGELEPERLARVRAQHIGHAERSLEEGPVRASRIAGFWLTPVPARELRPRQLWRASEADILRVAAAWTAGSRTTWVSRPPVTVGQAWAVALTLILVGSIGALLAMRRRRRAG
ncbi:MAG TPA: pitrilysin family protein [Myxococcota bacterium]|nr:pitrilysin family protein [Myxococcota bacterium]